MKLLAWTLIPCLLGASVAAHAEGACPRGMIDVGQQCSHGVCSPVCAPYSQQQQAPRPPPPQWADRWGAIATDEPRGVLGSVTGMPSEAAAKEAAVADCKAKGGINCTQHMLAYANGCGAVVVGSKTFSIYASSTVAEVRAFGMKTCTDTGNVDCFVFFTACSPAVRIR